MTETFKRSCTCGCLNPIEMIDRVALTADLRGKRTDNSLSSMKLEIDDLRARLEKVEKATAYSRPEEVSWESVRLHAYRSKDRIDMMPRLNRIKITDEMVARGAREVRILFGHRAPDTAMHAARRILEAALNG